MNIGDKVRILEDYHDGWFKGMIGLIKEVDSKIYGVEIDGFDKLLWFKECELSSKGDSNNE